MSNTGLANTIDTLSGGAAIGIVETVAAHVPEDHTSAFIQAFIALMSLVSMFIRQRREVKKAKRDGQ